MKPNRGDPGYRAYRARINARARRRYATDPGFRAAEIARKAKARRESNPFIEFDKKTTRDFIDNWHDRIRAEVAGNAGRNSPVPSYERIREQLFKADEAARAHLLEAGKLLRELKVRHRQSGGSGITWSDRVEQIALSPLAFLIPGDAAFLHKLARWAEMAGLPPTPTRRRP